MYMQTSCASSPISDPSGFVYIDRAVRLGTEMAREQADEQLGPIDVGPEAIAYATDRLRSKIARDAVYDPVGEVYSGLLSYGFLSKRRPGGKVIYHHNRQLEPKPPAPTDDWLVDYVRRNGPLSIPQWRDLFTRRTTQYVLYRFERLWRADRLSRSWMPHIEGATDGSLIYAPRLPTMGGRP
jgi:hypothetical protein